ncbi:hypothetical protein DYB38_005260 [Aphanomyces astaci]|uniref:Uncharacterized protein n=1 Tax=Aphanomyces astaci TaxID=112090 RepID=A0A397C652_APHAT|nr:hypothetical protein DYB38_005260 [Aphanomyces astaci]RHY66513.1 hypothetical protein DYB34_005761 [Aphanomyces astaci]
MAGLLPKAPPCRLRDRLLNAPPSHHRLHLLEANSKMPTSAAKATVVAGMMDTLEATVEIALATKTVEEEMWREVHVLPAGTLWTTADVIGEAQIDPPAATIANHTNLAPTDIASIRNVVVKDPNAAVTTTPIRVTEMPATVARIPPAPTAAATTGTGVLTRYGRSSDARSSRDFDRDSGYGRTESSRGGSDRRDDGYGRTESSRGSDRRDDGYGRSSRRDDDKQPSSNGRRSRSRSRERRGY